MQNRGACSFTYPMFLQELQSAENQTGDNREIKRAWDMVGDGFPFPFPGHRIIKNGLIDSNGRQYSCLEVASEYFRSAADKISIGSDAVLAAEEYLRTGVSIHLPTCFALHQADSSERATMKEVTRILGALLPPPQLTKKQTSPSPEKSVDYSQFLIDKGLHRL